MELREGVVVAERFRLEQELGRGGVGVVWAARHSITGRRVALKFVQQPAHARDVVRKRFVLEARAATALDHPHAMNVIDVHAVDDATLVMVMEWLDGETLGERMRREETLSIEDTATLLLPVISAVGTAHEMGIVHRDLKPENIFITKRGVVKVLDFGLAKLVGTDEGVTQTGAMVGTPAYMPPEQGSADEAIDHRADVWALGAILFEALSGGRPVEGKTIAQVVRRLLEDGIPPLEAVAPHVPEDVAKLVDQMLARDVEDRLPDLRRAAALLAEHTDADVPAFGEPNTVDPALALDDLEAPSSRRVDPEPTLTTPGPAALSKREPPPSRMPALIGALVVAAGVAAWVATTDEDTVTPKPAIVTPSAEPSPVESAAPSATASATVAPRPAPQPEPTTEPSSKPKAPVAARPTPSPQPDATVAPAAPPPPPTPPVAPPPSKSGKAGLRLDPPF